jgi:PAS domain S-box-containing protein
MSNSKKIRNRLNKLFQEIKTTEATPEEMTKGQVILPASPKKEPRRGKSSKPEKVDAASTMTMTQTTMDGFASMAIPFRAGDTWNTLELLDEPTRKWQSDDQTMVQQIVDQLSLAMQNAQLFQQTQRQNTNLEVLNAMGSELGTQLRVDQVLETVFKYTSKLIDTSSFFFCLYDNESQELDFRLAISDKVRIQVPKRKLAGALTDYVIKNRTHLLLNGDIPAKMRELGLEVRIVGQGGMALSWLGTPLTIGDKVLGALVAQSVSTPFLYTEQERDLLIAVASQAAIALQNAQLFEQTQQQNAELAILNEMGSELSSLQSVEGVAEIVYRYAGRLMDVTNFFLALYHKESGEMSFPLTYFNGTKTELEQQDVGNGLTGQVIKTRQPVYVPENIEKYIEDHRLESLELADEDPALCWLGVPMILGAEILGVICVQSTVAARLYTERQRDLLVAIASQAAIAIQNTRLFNETQQRAADLSGLNEIMRAVSAEIDLGKVLEAAYEKVRKLIKLDAFLLGLYDEKTDTVYYPFIIDEGVRYEATSNKLNENSNTGKVIRTKKPILVLETPETLQQTPAGAFGNPGKTSASLLFVPLTQGNQIIGSMSVQSYQFNAYGENEIRLMENIASQLSVAIKNAQLYKEITSSETRFRDVALASADWVWEIDTRGVYTYCSDKVVDVLGYKPEEVLGKSPADFMPENQREQFSEIIRRILKDGERMVDLENRNIAKDGREVILLSSGVPIRDSNEEIAGYRGINKDVTIARMDAEIDDAIEKITAIGVATTSLEGAFPAIHEALLKLVPARNLYFALYDNKANRISYPYKKDDRDTSPWPIHAPGDSLTAYVIRTGKPFLGTQQNIDSLVEAKQIIRRGANSTSWLGIPLRTKETIGMFATQTYDESLVFTEKHLDILSRIAPQIATVVEKIRAEESLSKSESELRALFNSMNDVIIVYDKDGTYVRIAPTNPSRLVLPVDDLVGKNVRDVIPSELHGIYLDTIQRALQTDQTIQIEYPLNIGGQKFWFDASVSKLSENQVFWVARDITERKQAEEALRRQNEYLATATEVGRLITSTLDLSTLFDRTVNLIRSRFGYYHVAIFTADETGFNAVLREGTGEAGAEMKRRQHAIAIGSKSIIGNITSSGKTLVVNNTAIDPIHRNNPLLPDTRAEAGIPLKIGQRIIGALDIQAREVGAFMQEDIAVLETLADQIAVAIDNARSYDLAQKAVAEMRELDRIKSQFLANMSHELRTPLNSIIGFSRVILKGIDGPVTDQQHQDLSAIYNSGQHLLGLINDILDLSKIEAGKMELAVEEVNIVDTINSVMSTAIGLVKDKPVRLEKEIEANIPAVRADAMRIRQVLINLISNAAKFTEEGSITVKANSHVSSEGIHEVLVAVTDTGPGIDAEGQKKLFQAFSQVDSSATRKSGGTGLGLSICQRLVELHGGRIGVHSAPGQGSTFYFTVPMFVQPNREADPGEGKIILCVDDDSQVISLYERYLKPQGYQVVPVTNPATAKDAIRRLKPYAITLDIMMPDMDGWQLLSELKNEPDIRNVPIIVCSIVEEEEKGFSLGASDYLVKPILEDDLLNALNRLNGDGSINEVLVIDDSPEDLRLMEKILLSGGKYKPVLVEGGPAGWDAILNASPEAIILDLVMPELDGFTILERLKTDPKLRDIPVLVISGAELTPEQQKKLNALGKSLLQKGMLSQQELFAMLEKSLKRLQPR